MEEYKKKIYYPPKETLEDHFIKNNSLDLIKDVYKKQGLRKLIEQILKKALSPIFVTNSAIWFEKNLSEELIDFKPEYQLEFEIRPIDQTINWLKNQKQDWFINYKEIITAYEFDHYWPTVVRNGNIIGFIKIGFKNVYIVDFNKTIQFPSDTAFIYDTYILEEQRNKDIGSYLIVQTMKLLKSQGYAKVRCHIPPWNKISICVYEKMGFKKINYIRYFRIFGIPIKKVQDTKKIKHPREI